MANTLAAGMGYLVFGGWRLFRRSHDDDTRGERAADPDVAMRLEHWVTLGTIAVFFVGVVGFQVHVGMGAFAAAVVLTLAKVTDEKPVILEIPWGVIMMVCGVTVLTSLLEKTGGIDLFTTHAGAVRDASIGHGPDRARHGAGLGLQQHVRGGAAGVPAERAGTWSPSSGAAIRWRSPRRS